MGALEVGFFLSRDRREPLCTRTEAAKGSGDEYVRFPPVVHWFSHQRKPAVQTHTIAMEKLCSRDFMITNEWIVELGLCVGH